MSRQSVTSCALSFNLKLKLMPRQAVAVAMTAAVVAVTSAASLIVGGTGDGGGGCDGGDGEESGGIEANSTDIFSANLKKTRSDKRHKRSSSMRSLSRTAAAALERLRRRLTLLPPSPVAGRRSPLDAALRE